jgi:hypothetical protein
MYLTFVGNRFRACPLVPHKCGTICKTCKSSVIFLYADVWHVHVPTVLKHLFFATGETQSMIQCLQVDTNRYSGAP